MKRTYHTKDIKPYDWERIWKTPTEESQQYKALLRAERAHSGYFLMLHVKDHNPYSNPTPSCTYSIRDQLGWSFPALDDVQNTKADMRMRIEMLKAIRPGRRIHEIVDDLISIGNEFQVVVSMENPAQQYDQRYNLDQYGRHTTTTTTWRRAILMHRDNQIDRQRRKDLLNYTHQGLSRVERESFISSLLNDPRDINRFHELNNSRLPYKDEQPIPTPRRMQNNHNEPLIQDILNDVNALSKSGVPLTDIDNVDAFDDTHFIGSSRRETWE